MGEWAGMRDFICKNEQEYQPYLDVTSKFTVFPLNEEQTKSMDGFLPNEGPAANERK